MSVLANGGWRFVRRARRAWAAGVALLLSALWAAPALACTPPPGGVPIYTIAQRVQAADVVLEGDVTQVTQMQFPDDTAIISVSRYFKGNGPASVTITNFGPGGLCRSSVHVGDHWIFFAKGDPNTVMAASYLSQFDAVASATPNTIAQIIAALNSRPRAYLPLLAGGATRSASGTPQSAGERTLFGLAFVVVAALGVWLRFVARWL
jgi:hypothetical protein